MYPALDMPERRSRIYDRKKSMLASLLKCEFILSKSITDPIFPEIEKSAFTHAMVVGNIRNEDYTGDSL